MHTFTCALQVQASILAACEDNDAHAGQGMGKQNSLSCIPLTSGLLQDPTSSDFFDRDVEQSLLLAQLKESPRNVLVIVGPRCSGKSRLLEEVLLKKHKAMLTFVDGRAQKLTDAAIMTSALRKQARSNSLQCAKRWIKHNTTWAKQQQ